jgi:glycosyltransferase involved in cell wall biosynthesis
MKIAYCNTIDYWYPLQQRPHHIMRLLAKRGHEVHWVNSTKIDGMRAEKDDYVTLWHNWNMFKKRIPDIDVYFSSWSHRHTDLDEISAKIVVYDSLDNFEANETQEINMINKSNIVLTTSSPLYDLRKTQHDNVHICRNACFSGYKEHALDIPNDVKQFKNGYVLFSGAVANWVDIDLLDRVAKEHSLVIVGNNFDMSRMPKNAHYLGSKSYEELQKYYKHCKVNLLPFKRCQVADYSNPIKMYEGMVYGKITVATDIPEAKLYPDVVIPSANHIEFMNNLNSAIKHSEVEDIKMKCLKTAEENDWHCRVDVIENSIMEYATKRGISL